MTDSQTNPMATSEQRIARMQALLTDALEPTLIEIHNESHKHVGHAGAKTGLGHFKLIISSERLNSHSKLAQHRMIYDALGDMMQTDIHALIIEVVSG